MNLFRKIPDGLVSGDVGNVYLIGQLECTPSGNEVSITSAEPTGAPRSADKIWICTSPVIEWRIEPAMVNARPGAIASGDVSNNIIRDATSAYRTPPRLWVRSVDGAWILLTGRPHPRADNQSWRIPGHLPMLPMSDVFLSDAFVADSEPREKSYNLPCRTIEYFMPASSAAMNAEADTLNLRQVPLLKLLEDESLRSKTSMFGIVRAGEGEYAPLWIRTGSIQDYSTDYSKNPPAVWLRTEGGYYRLQQPNPAYAKMCQRAGDDISQPLVESALVQMNMHFDHSELEHPFTSKKGTLLPTFILDSFELCDAEGKLKSLLRTLPEGVLSKSDSSDEKRRVYLRGRAIPREKGGFSPFIWAGHIRGWTAETSSTDHCALWVCTSRAAYLLPESDAAVPKSVDAASGPTSQNSWQGNDGLLLRFASELIGQCRLHRDPSGAAKLFNNILSNAWARLPKNVSSLLKRDAVLCEKFAADFLIDCLHEANQKPFSKKFEEFRDTQLKKQAAAPRLAARSSAVGWPGSCPP